MTWITAWILVGEFRFYQPTYPPFKSQADCEAAAKVFNGKGGWITGRCVEATILVRN